MPVAVNHATSIGRGGDTRIVPGERLQPSLNMPEADTALRPLAQRQKQLPRPPGTHARLPDLGKAAFTDCLADTKIHPSSSPAHAALPHGSLMESDLASHLHSLVMVIMRMIVNNKNALAQGLCRSQLMC